MTSVFLINNHKYKIAIGVFICYLILAMYKIGTNSLWLDECFSVDAANDTIKDIFLISEKDINPPLYLIILHYWMKFFGESEAALRSLSALGMSGAVAVMFLYSLKYFNWQTAIFSVIIFFTANELYLYSQEGRTYGLILLFTALSNFCFLGLIKKSNIYTAILLGICNAIIFYLHTLASFVFIFQALLFLVMSYKKQHENTTQKLVVGYGVADIFHYAISNVTWLLLFLPWYPRLRELLSLKQTLAWSVAPTFQDFKTFLYDYHTNYIVFYGYVILLTASLISIFFQKNQSKNQIVKFLLFGLISGPVIFIANYFLSINVTPIFLKRYVLFSMLGFITLYAYAFSCVNIKFMYKAIIIFPICIYAALCMEFPKKPTWQYRDGLEFVMKHKTKHSYITNDIPMMLSYYISRDTIFHKQEGIWRDALLNKLNIFPSYGLKWQNEVDFSNYTDIFYTSSFGGYSDPDKVVEKDLHNKFIFIRDTSLKGMYIAQFKITSKQEVSAVREQIKNSPEWYEQVKTKAKTKNISVDSMLTLDAVWSIKEKYTKK